MKRIKFLRRILASSLAVLLCCTSFNMTALAAEDSELPYGITSEQEIAVTQVDEENSCLDGIEEEAYQRDLGVVAQEIIPGLPSAKTWGQALSPFKITATKKDPTVTFTMTAPTLGSNEESFANAYGLGYKVAVQDADDPSAPVMFFAASVDKDNNSVTATIPVGSETKLCALVQVDTANLTKNVTYSAQNQVAMPESIYENADGSVLHFSWTYQLDGSKTPGGLGMFGFDASYYEVNLNLGSLVLDPDTVQVTSETYSNGTPTEWKEGTGYWTIPLEVTDTDEESVCKPFTISFDCTIPSSEFGDTDSVMPMAEFVFDVYHNGPGSNLKPALSISDAAPLTSSTLLLPAVTITPADMTIYQGGEDGYEGVYDDDQTDLGSDSLPHPLFKITPASGSSVTNPTQLTFTNDGKSWTVKATEDSDLYYFEPASDTQDPVRVTYSYTNKDGEKVSVINDEFDVSQVGNTYAEYTIDLYPGDNNFNDVRAKTDTNQEGWPISVNSGKLTVRAVEKETGATSDIVEGTQAEDGSVSYDGKVSAGSAVAVVPENTTYTLNNTDVQLPDDHGASLLFDNIITSDANGEERMKKLEDTANEWLNKNGEATSTTRNLEFKYLDLVDANNGNAWIKASNPVTIYWGYPDGTDQSTNFKLLHFEGLHRDTSGGGSTGFNPGDIANATIKAVEVKTTENGITFQVGKGGFSPFVLVWDAAPTTYIITASAEGGGTVSPNGSVTVTEGDSQTFAITPNNGYHIEDVLVDGVSVGAVSTYTFSNVTANHTITATFERNSLPIHYYTITATAGEGGAIAPDGTVRVAQGADRTFTISAAEGYVIADVLVDGESIGAVDSYTFENVRQNHTIEARFQPVSDVADPDDTGVSDWLNTDDHLAYLDGYPDNTFQPEEDMTRAEAAQMFYNLLRDQDVDTTVSFTDVAADAWYAEAVNTLATLEIVDGVGDNRFAPERTITRAEFTTMAMRFCQEIPTGENIFSDVDQDDWFYDYVVGSIQYGWINGYPDGTFRPNDTITRAEVTTIANRMLGRAADEAYVDGHQDQLRAFPDVTKGYWAYYDITEATNAHEYTKDSQGEDWTGLA